MALHNEIGKQGEAIALKYIEEKGFRVINKNWRHRKAEIDIIASENEDLVIVEVKTLSNANLTQPENKINRKKIAMLIEATDYYCKLNDIDKNVRFDIISIILKPNLEIRHIKNAFQSVY